MKTPEEVNEMEIEREEGGGKKDIFGVLVYDSNTEEGCIEIEADFFDEHPIIQLDILQDWIEAATDLYNHTLSEFQRKH
jgi:hypothetical protein